MSGPVWRLGVVLLLSGCASITTGSTQSIEVASTPDGAECTLTRGGTKLGTVTTPGVLTVKRARESITVDCVKDGYEDARTIMNAGVESATRGNLVLGGFIGMAVDNSTGANSRYDPSVSVELTALSAADRAAGVAGGGPRRAYDGDYVGEVDMLQVNVQPNVPHRRVFAVHIENGVGTGTARHESCGTPGEVSLQIAPSGEVRGRANMRNTTGCTDRFATLQGYVDGAVLRLTVRVVNNPELVLTRGTGPSTAAAAPTAPPQATAAFDGNYRGGLEVAQGDMRQMWLRVRGTNVSGTSRVALCPTPGAIRMTIDPSGAVRGEADVQTSTTCRPRRAVLSGRADGRQIVVTASFADDSRTQEIVFNRERRGVGVDD